MENLVRESIIRSTSLPWSRKYSAIAVAVFAALFLISAGLSDVATTRTLLFIPSGPKSLSANSLTSRPRSPIRAITLMSALVLRANIPMSVLLPTPLPANIPILCPLPTVRSPSTALTPKGRTSLMITLDIGSGGAASTEYSSVSPRSSPSTGLPRPSSVCPRIPNPTFTPRGLPVFSTIQPGPIPSTVSKGIRRTTDSLNPTTSALTTWLLSAEYILHKSLSFASGPTDSTVSPTILDTFPSFL